MASAFDKLRDKSGQMKKLGDKIVSEKNNYDDARIWKLTVDKKQVGSAVIRFLPAPDGEEYPYVKMYEHSFEWPHKGSGQYFIENCPTTIEREDCPCCAANNDEWVKGTDKAKEVARYRKRNLSYIANICVVDDPAKPENNGKVFLFKFGARIFQKIEGALKPEFADIVAINPFDLWEGANFKLRARELDGQRSYDMSVFDTVGPLDTDDRMEAIWKSEHSLTAEVAPTKFKSEADLLARWNKVMGVKAPVGEGATPAPEGTTASFQRRSDAKAAAALEAQEQPSGEDGAPWDDQAEMDAAADSIPVAEPPAPAPAPKPAAPKPPVQAPAAPKPPAPAPAPAPAAAGTGGSLADKYRAMLKK